MRGSIFLTAVLTLLAVLGLTAGPAMAQITTYDGNTGNWNKDTWNDAGNWDNGIPTGTIDANIADGQHASVYNVATTPVYDGNLILGVGSTVQIGQTNVAACLNALGTGTWVMNSGSDITLRFTANTTHDNDINLLGDATIAVGRSTSAHHKTREFSGQISGTGQLIVHTTNNNTVKFSNSTSDWSGGLWAGDIHDENNRATIQGMVTGSLGTGDIRIDRDVDLVISAENAMGTSAKLILNGPGRSDKNYKLKLDANQTVGEFWLDGTQAIAGTVLDSSASFINGSGQLIVTGGAVDVAPTLDGAGIEDQVYGGPIYEDVTSFLYHVTFSDDMDENTISADDFEILGTGTATLGTVTKIETPILANDPSTFAVEVIPSTLGTLQLQVKSGAELKDIGGLALDTTSAIADIDIITYQAGTTPASTITGTDGGSDSWNTASNWDNGVPWGPTPTVVGAGVKATVSTVPPSYYGHLTLQAGSELEITSENADVFNAFSTTGITMEEGSSIDLRTSQDPHFAAIELAGNASFISTSNAADWDSRYFDGEITGDGNMTITGRNGEQWHFNTANPDWNGDLVSNATDRHYIKLNATGAVEGDITITPRADGRSASLQITAENAMGPETVLILNGDVNKGGFNGNGSNYLIMDANATISELWVWGAQMPDGDYDNTYDWLTGNFILTVKALVDLPDTNGDGVVDALDYLAIKQNFGLGSGATLAQGDVDGDGDVDWDDLQMVTAEMNTAAGAGTIPEPATLGLLAIGALALVRRRRRS